jgi:hypothetical protein
MNTFAVRIVIGLFNLIGWLAIAGAAVWAIAIFATPTTMQTGGPANTTQMLLASIPAGGIALVGIFTLAQAQILDIIRHIEMNTRPHSE